MDSKNKRATKQSKRGKKLRRRKLKKAGRPKQKGDELFGFMADGMEIVGDIVSPSPDWKYWRPAECLKK